MQTAARSPRPVVVRLVITADALTSLLRERATDQMQDPQVYFGEGTAVITGRVQWQGRQFYVTVRGHPALADGDVNIVVDEIMVGRVHAPAQMQAEAARRINHGLDQLLARNRLYAETVEIRPGVMIVTGRAGGGS